jgi:hypothetical protein
MKRLAFLSFILAVLATPAQAQTQTQQPPAPLGFNGHVFDPPLQQYEPPRTVRVRPAPYQVYRSYAAPPPVGYDPYYGDARAQRYR